LPAVTKVDAFQFDRELGVWMNPGHGAFDYSEGAKVERKTLEILRSTRDVGLFSPELIEKISSWPTLYHFSPARHNLLRHLTLSRETSILELGAGCGAITRQFAEAAGDVWAVEGGPVRAACTAARCRDLSNVRVFCSDFQDIDPGRKFDVVTLIGVLEYSPVFFKGGDPFRECLDLARSFLEPGGVLLLAIENQLGLKYFCGAPEDHTGKPYDGVQDLYQSGGVRTVGRAELGRVLRDAGFAGVEFQYPFPDYKLPSWVVTQLGLETEGFDPAAILGTIEPVHDGRPMSLPADERRIRPVLQRNGLLADLSNSFLVLATPSPGAARSPGLSPPGLLAAGYVTDREPWFNTRTTMRVEGDGTMLVEKSRLTPGDAPAGVEILNVTSVRPYRSGTQLDQAVTEALRRDDLDAATRLLRRWIDHLLAHGLATRDERDPYASVLKPDFFDCTPANLVIEGEGLAQIDLEWHYLGQLPVRTLALRYLKLFTSKEAALLRRHLNGRADLADQLLQRLGIRFSPEQERAAREQLSRINSVIVPAHRGRLPPAKRKRRKSLLSRLLRRKKKPA
jgi:SAM-dependent methyltransferase